MTEIVRVSPLPVSLEEYLMRIAESILTGSCGPNHGPGVRPGLRAGEGKGFSKG